MKHNKITSAEKQLFPCAFLLFTECVKETEYKGLIKIK